MEKPKYFIWRYQTLVEVGSGCRDFAPDRFSDMGSTRVVMITDKGLVKAGIAEEIGKVFEAKGKPLAGIYDEIEQDAGTNAVNKCARWCRSVAADGLLAVGGGSVLDSVKAVKVMMGLQLTEVKEILTGPQERLSKPLAKPTGIAHVSIPTTAGTGAEVSYGSVIYLEDLKKKMTFRHDYANSDYALLDPDLTVALPPKLTAETGFDALSHAIEGYFGPKANSMSEALSLQACRLINRYLPIAVSDGGNIEARTEMLVASNIAVMGLALGGGAVPIHNFAHAVGGTLRIPHGRGNAVFMASVMKNMFSYYEPRAQLFAQAMGIHTAGMSRDQMLGAAISRIEELQKICGIDPVIRIELDAAQFEIMFEAVKTDYTTRLFHIPEPIIKACLKDCFVIR